MARETVEALLNPSLKVSRPVAACARCRSAKIKCDGKLPACSACERAGKSHDCSSASDEFARGKERSYVAALETAIQKLQSKIDDATMVEDYSRRNSIMMLTHGRPPVQPRSLSNSQRKEASSVDELVSDFGFLTVNATSRDFSGFSETMSFTKLLRAMAMKQALPIFDEEALPPRQDVSHLINHYFENNYVLLPFLSETEFMTSLSKIYAEQQAQSLVSPYDLWCVRMILAISLASICRARGDEHYNAAIRHVSAAMNLAEYVLYPGSVVGIQALLLLVQYSIVDPEYFDSWYLIGTAARLTVDLGLHCELSAETKTSRRILDLRRRVFYCVYALDRVVSMSLGMSFSFTDDSAPNVQLPTLATEQETKSPSQLFLRSIRPSLFLFDIRRVQSAFYQKTRWSARSLWTPSAANEYISNTLQDIRAWQSTLPSSFSQKHLQAFKLESLYTQVIVLSPNQVIPETAMSEGNKFLFFDAAVQYADQMRMMSQNTDMQACLLYTDYCRARYVSRQFQIVMWANYDLLLQGRRTSTTLASTPNSPAPDNCSTAIAFLNTMSQILEWPKQRWAISALKDIFAKESAVLLARLQTRQQEYGLSPVSITSRTTSPSIAPLSYTDVGSFHIASTQHEIPLAQPCSSNYAPYPSPPEEQVNTYPQPATQHPGFFASPPPVKQNFQNSIQLPPGSLPRRHYEFQGGQT